MSNRAQQSYDTFTRVELTTLIQSHKLEIDKLKEGEDDAGRVGQCQVFPAGFQSEMDKSDRDHWSVAWSDLMMTMFILFVVLYCYQISFHPPVWGDVTGRNRASAVVGGERNISTTSVDPLGAPAEYSMASKYKEGRMVLHEKNMGEFAALDLVNDKTMRVSLSGDLLFAEGQSELLPQARYFLLDLIPILRMAPYEIAVVGHADRSVQESQYRDGWTLSMQRAAHVARILMASGGLAEDRFVISGAGSSQPAFADVSSENRRVELILTLEELDDHVEVVKPIKPVLN